MRTILQPADGDHYQRPHQTWLCGLGEEGISCPPGPDAQGRCPRATACHPTRDGDRWLCNRSPLRGGPCPMGPGPDGSCANVHCCTPRRSLRSRRGQFALGCAMATLGALLMTLSAKWRNEVIAPGPLTFHHAQLLDPTRHVDRCGACHAAGKQGTLAWLGIGSGDSRPPLQTELCLACHDKLIAPNVALAAHTSPQLANDPHAGGTAERATSVDEAALGHHGEQGRRRDPGEPIACAACHREHQGAKHPLASIDNASCQACHRQRFTSLADGHPEFHRWPYAARPPIQFDHASHGGKHFPQAKQDFQCAACHTADPGGKHQTTQAYAQACAQCHDQAIERSWLQGVALLSLPELDVEKLQNTGRFSSVWPREAVGDFDGGLTTVNRLLLLGDATAAKALTTLGIDFNAFDVDVDDSAQLKALAELMTAQRQLIDALANDAQATVRSRIEKVLQRKLSIEEMNQLVGGLSPDVIGAYQRRWFGTSQGAPEPSTVQRDAKESSRLSDVVPAGAWIGNANSPELLYRPRGHADPWLRAWIDVAAEAANNPQDLLADGLLEELLKPTSPGLCGSCHTKNQSPLAESAMLWRMPNPSAKPRSFTHFDHGPHLAQPQLRDCRSCHRTTHENPPTEHSVPVDRGVVADLAQTDFEPIEKAACSSCHTPKGAGDSCTQCHHYHVSAPQNSLAFPQALAPPQALASPKALDTPR